jgi:hypothetical protein
MTTTRFYRTGRTVILALAASGIMVSADYSLASDYRHQATSVCNALVDGKGLKGPARKAEYQKCKADPLSYK